MTTSSLANVAFAAALILVSSPTNALTNRAWVSGHGSDSPSCGAPTAPCRSLQYAHDNIIAAGGEIDILDPAGYGALTISKAISIVNDGVGTAGVQQTPSGKNAIQINANASDAVTLRGLTIDGLGVARDGVGLSKAASLTLINCVVRHFVHDGIYLQPTSGLKLAILNTIASDNQNDGFDLSPSGTGYLIGVIDRSTAFNNSTDGVSAWGANTSYYVFVTVANSSLYNNGRAGLYAYTNSAGSDEVMVRNTIADYNSYGYFADGASIMVFSRSEALVDFGPDIEIGSGAIGWSLKDNAAGYQGGITGTLGTMSSE